MISDNIVHLLADSRRRTISGCRLFLAVLFIAAPSTQVIATDLEKGQKSFVKCMVCHSVEKDVSKIGPSLYGVYGRKSGTLESFPNYSDAIKSADIVWDDKTIRELLKAPRTYIPNTKMLFIGIKDDAEIDNLLAYLRSVTGADATTETSDAETTDEGSTANTTDEAATAETAKQ